MMLIGKRLLPDHKDESLTEEFAMREYLSEIVVIPSSQLIGQKIFESDLAKMDFRILEVIRAKQKFLPNARMTIQPPTCCWSREKSQNSSKSKRLPG